MRVRDGVFFIRVVVGVVVIVGAAFITNGSRHFESLKAGEEENSIRNSGVEDKENTLSEEKTAVPLTVLVVGRESE